MDQTLPCPSCSRLCRIDAADLGGDVACPHCGRPFRAEVPLVGALPVAELLPPPPGLSPALVGLALLPWGVPVLWLLALVLSGVEPIFTFAVPVALAAGATGLALGVGSASLWSPATRVKGLVALLCLSYGLAGSLYFLKREWAAALRQKVGRGSADWKAFSPGGPNPRYIVKLPGDARPTDTPVPGWPLTAYRCTDGGAVTSDSFVVAHGRPPDGAPAEAGAWFDAARAGLTAGGGQVFAEADVPAKTAGYAARQYVVGLPDGVTNRVVRVFRGKGQTYYLAAEGLFFNPDSRDVKAFFGSFVILGR